MSALRYRTDIDGLRAVAVLGVVIYHAFPKMVPGGYTGVDIFFVISGYLISGILYKESVRGVFSFGEFYVRRVRRLFPALIAVLIFCFGYGWLILLPDEFKQLGKHLAAGIIFSQNFVLFRESGYFDAAANLKPLLHLWSLAVEEQFYILFPPLFLLVFRKNWPLLRVLGLLLTASLVGNLVMSEKSEVLAFYLMPYRIWEFLGGSLLARHHFAEGSGRKSPGVSNAFSLAGIVLIAVGMAAFQHGDPYPGWRALLPVLGTVMLIEGGETAWVNRVVLSQPAMVWFGLISYPLYLWHWPSLAFVQILKGPKPKPVYCLKAVAFSIILAVLTYYFLEKRLRHERGKWVVCLLCAAFLLVGFAGWLAFTGRLPSRSIPAALVKSVAATRDGDSLAGLRCLSQRGTVLLNHVGGEGKLTLFFGDSNMQQYAPRIREILKNANSSERGALFLTAGGVPPIPGVSRVGVSGSEDLHQTFRELSLYETRVDRVVIAARWDLYFSPSSKYYFGNRALSESAARRDALEAFGQLIREKVESKKRVTVLLSTPNGEGLNPKLYAKRGFFAMPEIRRVDYTRSQHIEYHGEMLREIASVAVINGAEVVDPLEHLCEGEVCIAENDEGPIRYDANHLRPGFVRDHVKFLDTTVSP